MQQATSFGRRGVTPSIISPARHQPATVAASNAPPELTWSQTVEPPASPAWSGIEFYGAPVVTTLLAVILALLFWVEQVAAVSPPANGAPGYLSLMALGGVSNALVFRDGQVWRLFTAPWLHANLAHLIGNSVVLAIVGFRLERLVRSAWFLAIFMASAVGGSLVSAALNTGGPVSVGASGAIMGLLGACLTLSFHAAAQGERARLRVLAMRLLIPALLPTHGGIDYSCHLGGALTGAALGLVLKAVWPEGEAKPGYARQAGVISGAVAALSLLGFLIAAIGYGGYVRRQAGLIPDALIPHKPGNLAVATDLTSRFPRDPRGYTFQALAELKTDPAAAEQALRTGLAQADVLDQDMPPMMRPDMQALLGALLLQEGRLDEARVVAAPLCQATDLRTRAMRARLVHAHLCSG